MNISALQSLYRGFYIDTPVGNNAFSFDARMSKRIFVPPLIEGALEDVVSGDEVVFSEIEDGVERNAKGLKAFVHIKRPAQDIFIFDNHNHAFCFWTTFTSGVKGGSLVHVDQHKDTRMPGELFNGTSLQEAFYYTNNVLNVGNFIRPALLLGWFSEVVQVGTTEAFEAKLPQEFVLDIDMDIFAPAMDHIPFELKCSRLREWIQRARFVTIATSPFFMDQIRAVDIIRRILDVETK